MPEFVNKKKKKRTWGGNGTVPWLLFGSILIAASMKDRRVPFTVQILISVIAFQSGRSTTEAAKELCLPPTSRHSTGFNGDPEALQTLVHCQERDVGVTMSYFQKNG